MRGWKQAFSAAVNSRPRRRKSLAKLQPRCASARFRLLLFEHFEPRSLLATLVNTGTAADVIYTLPAVADQVFLEDDGTSGNGMLQLRSANGTFDTTVFANPGSSLTIKRGNAADRIDVGALPDFTAALTIGSPSSGFGSIFFAGNLTLGVDNSLTANAVGEIGVQVGSSRVDLQACKLEYSIVSPK